MTKFLFVYRNDVNAGSKMSPELMQQQLKKWETWIGEGLRQGWLIDTGDALTLEGRVVNGKKTVTDGPFVEAKEIIGGYSVVQADTIDAAAEIAKGCPVLLTGGSVEVRSLVGFTAKK
jgi:hypothetical protein